MDYKNQIKKVIHIDGKAYTALPNIHFDVVEIIDFKYVVDDNRFENEDYILYYDDPIDMEQTYEERTKLLNSYTDYIRNLTIEATDYCQRYPSPQLCEFINRHE
jgi:hypothetical protein